MLFRSFATLLRPQRAPTDAGPKATAASVSYPRGDHPLSERRLLQYLRRLLKRLGLINRENPRGDHSLVGRACRPRHHGTLHPYRRYGESGGHVAPSKRPTTKPADNTEETKNESQTDSKSAPSRRGIESSQRKTKAVIWLG